MLESALERLWFDGRLVDVVLMFVMLEVLLVMLIRKLTGRGPVFAPFLCNLLAGVFFMSAHAVVIGSGFGGLAAAVRLGARGYRVTVLERLDAPGGRAYVHHQDGFTFDAGPTIVTVPFVLEELWELCGKNMHDHVQLRSLTPFYQIRFCWKSVNGPTRSGLRGWSLCPFTRCGQC